MHQGIRKNMLVVLPVLFIGSVTSGMDNNELAAAIVVSRSHSSLESVEAVAQAGRAVAKRKREESSLKKESSTSDQSDSDQSDSDAAEAAGVKNKKSKRVQP